MKKKGVVLSPGSLRLWRKEAEELAGGSKKDRAERIFNALKEAHARYTREERIAVIAKNVRRRIKERRQEMKNRHEKALAAFRGKIERRLARGIVPGKEARFYFGRLDIIDADVRAVRTEYNKRGFRVTWKGHYHLGNICAEGALVFRNRSDPYYRERFPKNDAMHVARY